MNKKLIIASVLSAVLLLPLAAFAQNVVPANINFGNVPGQLANNMSISGLINLAFGFVWPLIMAFIIIMFILAGFSFFNAHGDDTKLVAARNEIIWGVVGLVVLLLAFSLPFVIRNSLPGV